MSRFGKKPRVARTAFKVKGWRTRIGLALRDRGIVLRLAVCAVAIALLVIAVSGWHSTFHYRLGSRAEQGVISRIDFQILNPSQTERAQRDAKAGVKLVFRHDPSPLSTLPAKLRVNLQSIAEADRLSVLPSSARQAFGLDPETPTGSNAEQNFATLKNSITGTNTAAGRIDEIRTDFADFLKQLETFGAIDPKDVERLELKPDQVITVVAVGGEKRETVVADVQVAELIAETGRLGKTWTEFPRLVQIRSLLEYWLRHHNVITLSVDEAAYDAAVKLAITQAGDQFDTFKKGGTLLPPGATVDLRSLGVLRAEFDAVESEVPIQYRTIRIAIVTVMFVVMVVLFAFYLVRNEPKITNSAKRLAIFLGVIILTVVAARLLSGDPWQAELIPLTATAMLFAIAYNQVLASMTVFVLSLLISLSTLNELGHFVVLLTVSATSIIPLGCVPSRSSLIKVGFLTAIVCFVATWGMGVLQHQSPMDIWDDPILLSQSLKWSFWCVVVGFLVSGSLPFIESGFGVVTDISLLEMADVSHPLLQELVRRAPGTYNHSISVATIGETAADAIGANGLLVRVGAYFHDIGKMLKPEYFIENIVNGDNRHNNLAPAMSTLIIIGHVKDGADLGRQHNLPQSLIDFIEQHHGTTLVEYFFYEATKKADEDHKSDAEESSFRYPGPKPQSREAGVMMLADAVESASRTLNSPTPKRLETLIREVSMKRLLDGQFDDSTLTLSEIRIIEESLTKSLIGIHHGRVKYPDQKLA
ncbi:MAG: HDIG domain-containing protein [Planctomycetota bacterium]|nr:HDIG domain-containing protein [Planctomycetota bacterium]